jgi:hypothetical protein
MYLEEFFDQLGINYDKAGLQLWCNSRRNFWITTVHSQGRPAGDVLEVVPGYWVTSLPAPVRVMSQAEAKAEGVKRYWTGKSCKHGHPCCRYTSNGCCIKCHEKAMRDARKRKRDGLTGVTVRVHEDDRYQMQALANALNAARGL